MTLTTTTNLILSSLTVIGQLMIIGFFLSLIVHRRFADVLIHFFGKNSLIFAFIVALAATTGSLFYSEVIGFEPCRLCWFQRIFMYPQVVLLGLALLRRDHGIALYSITLSIIGAVIATYHYLLQIGVSPSLSCQAVGYSISCSSKFVLQFGYITIPMMALTAFLLIIFFFYLHRLYEEH